MGMPFGNEVGEGKRVQASVHTRTDSLSACIRTLACAQKRGCVSGVRRVSEARARPRPHNVGRGERERTSASASASALLRCLEEGEDEDDSIVIVVVCCCRVVVPR